MGDSHVRFEVAFGRGLWLRMKAMSKEVGNGEMILLDGYGIVNQWSFAGDVDRNKETMRCERGWDWVDGEHGVPRISQKMDLN